MALISYAVLHNLSALFVHILSKESVFSLRGSFLNVFGKETGANLIASDAIERNSFI